MSNDPYRYFRIEAREIVDGMSRGLLDLERNHDPEAVRQILRLAHTLKGAARVVRLAEIADLAHEIEDLLAPFRESEQPPDRDTIDRVFELGDRIREGTSVLDAPVEAKSAVDPRAADRRFDTVRIEIADVDRLLEGLGEIESTIRTLRTSVDAFEEAILPGGASRVSRRTSRGERHHVAERVQRELRARLDQIDVEVDELREQTGRLRLVSAESLVHDLERAIRDAAQSLGRKVDFRSRGSETRIDAHVLPSLRTALLHIVRNAVAHGIEDESERIAAGKPTAGAIFLEIERRGHQIALTCRDDGRGLDAESIRKVAVERGLVPLDRAPSTGVDDLVPLLLRGGLSTSRTVTTVAGRGIGLEIVREAIRAVKGDIGIRTELGRGTVVEITAPVSLSSMPVLHAEAGGTSALIPLEAVREARMIGKGDLIGSPDGERLAVEGELVPFFSLSRSLRSEGPPKRPADVDRCAVVLHGADRIAAVGVQRLRGVRTAVVHNLPEPADSSPIVAGATLGEGSAPELVLSPLALIDAAMREREPTERPAASPPVRLLVIDDSLTTRMLEKSILESAGYQVDVAISGEEALEKAKRKSYALFIVDIEMPGIDGFEFIARSRSDPDLRNVPSILVTSRTDSNDRRRGMEAGARAYIVKSEFDQRVLLEAIRSLVG